MGILIQRLFSLSYFHIQKAKFIYPKLTYSHTHLQTYPTGSIIMAAQPYPQYRPLYRSSRDIWLAGVCAGIGEHFNIDPIIIRILWIILTICTLGIFLFLYVLLVIVVKTDPYGYQSYAQYYPQQPPRSQPPMAQPIDDKNEHPIAQPYKGERIPPPPEY